jgi:predicted RNase H-like nuclease (RuvC/YqgF family)|nr:MAG TPA: hypothetical protein [Caudoviricetes sp.]
MKQKDLKIDFRYLTGNIACLSVDSISGESVHNDINNEEAIIIFNSLVGEKADCQTVKSLLKENQELKKQLEEYQKDIKDLDNQNKRAFENMQLNQLKVCNMIKQQKEFINYLEDEIHSCEAVSDLLFNSNKEMKVYKEILQKYKEIIGDDK